MGVYGDMRQRKGGREGGREGFKEGGAGQRDRVKD